MNELLTQQELMEKLKVSRQTLYVWINQGMPCVLKKPYRFDLEAVINWVNKEKSPVAK